MPVRLRIESGPHEGLERREILRRAAAILACLQLQKAELSIVLTGDSQIQKLNDAYRGKNRPTDVLAFAMREGDFARLAGDLLGDVIVSVPTARNQAAARKHPLIDELTMLLAHGLLHLLGWDHETKSKDARMRAETARLCRAASPAALPARPTRAARRQPRAPSAVKGRSGAPSRSRSSRARPARRA